MNKLTKNKRNVEVGIDDIIEYFIKTQKEINNTSAYSIDETENRIKLFHKRDTLEHVLACFGIRAYELDFDEYNSLEIK